MLQDRPTTVGNIPHDVRSVLQGSQGRAVLFGIGAALVGGVAWFLVAHFLDVQHSAIAIGVGVIIGLAMRSQFQGGRSVPLGLVAAVLSVAGILFGNLLIWQYTLPRILVNEVRKIDPTTTITEGDVHTLVPFIEYMKEDLGLGEPSLDASGKPKRQNYMSWLFYGLAMYVGFASLRKKEEEKKEIST